MSQSPVSQADPKLDPPVDGQEEVKPTEQQDDDGYIRLNRKELNQEILRLQREDPEFNQLFQSHVGKKAENKYLPKLSAKDREIEQLRKELRIRDVSAMDPKDVETKFQSDPAFAKEYAELVHFQKSPKESPTDNQAEITAAWNRAVEDARGRGVSEDFIRQVSEKAVQGGYEVDGHWSESLDLVKSDFLNEILRQKLDSPKPTEKEKVNESLVRSGPDLSKGVQGTVKLNLPSTLEAVKRLSPTQRRELIATPEGKARVEELLKKTS